MYCIDKTPDMDNKLVIPYPKGSNDVFSKEPLYIMPAPKRARGEDGNAVVVSYGFTVFVKDGSIGGKGIYTEEQKNEYLEFLSEKEIKTNIIY